MAVKGLTERQRDLIRAAVNAHPDTCELDVYEDYFGRGGDIRVSGYWYESTGWRKKRYEYDRLVARTSDPERFRAMVEEARKLIDELRPTALKKLAERRVASTWHC